MKTQYSKWLPFIQLSNGWAARYSNCIRKLDHLASKQLPAIQNPVRPAFRSWLLRLQLLITHTVFKICNQIWSICLWGVKNKFILQPGSKSQTHQDTEPLSCNQKVTVPWLVRPFPLQTINNAKQMVIFIWFVSR